MSSFATPVYIDGQAGTTALRIKEWLANRNDIEIITLPDSKRKDESSRKEALAAAKIAILCLPDEAAREVVDWCDSLVLRTTLIDASTAHRTHDDWTYGLPELTPEHRSLIKESQRISNPGCYSSSFILLTRPLRDAGILSEQAPIHIHALSGYSGGGKQLIEKWQSQPLKQLPYEAPYACFNQHKHIPEMMKYAQLNSAPIFQPAVGAFECGMRVQVPLHQTLLNGVNAEEVYDVLRKRYEQEKFIHLMPLQSENSQIDESSYDPRACNETNSLKIYVQKNQLGHINLMAILDNLGKGASGMAIQSLNLLLNSEENTSLPNIVL